MKDEIPYQISLTSLLCKKLLAAKSQHKPFFKKPNRKSVDAYTDNMRAKLLFGCELNELPKGLRAIVQDVFDKKRALDNRLQYKLDYVADKLSKRPIK